MGRPSKTNQSSIDNKSAPPQNGFIVSTHFVCQEGVEADCEQIVETCKLFELVSLAIYPLSEWKGRGLSRAAWEMELP